MDGVITYAVVSRVKISLCCASFGSVQKQPLQIFLMYTKHTFVSEYSFKKQKLMSYLFPVSNVNVPVFGYLFVSTRVYCWRNQHRGSKVISIISVMTIVDADNS